MPYPPSHKHCFLSNTNPPPLKSPQTKESRSLFRGEHHQQNNLTNLKIYQPENKKGVFTDKNHFNNYSWNNELITSSCSDSEKYSCTYILNGRLIGHQFIELGIFGPCRGHFHEHCQCLFTSTTNYNPTNVIRLTDWYGVCKSSRVVMSRPV